MAPTQKEGSSDARGSKHASAEIAARLEAERALGRGETKYRLLAEHSRDIIWTMDPGGTITYMSPAEERVLGYRPDERVGRDVTQASMTPASQAQATGHFRRMAAGDLDEVRFEAEHIRKDGTHIWCEIHAFALREASGALISVLGTTRDISERHEITEALKQSEERYRLVADNVADVIYVYGPDERILYVSPSVQRVFGYSPEERIGRRFDETAMLAADVDRVREMFAAAARGEMNEVLFEAEHLCKDGSHVWAQLNCRAVRADNGALQAVLVVARDITQWREAREALRVSEERYRELAERSQDPIMIYSASGHMTYASPAAEKIWGVPVAELLGRHYSYALDEASLERSNAAVARLNQGSSEPEHLEVRHRLGGGRELWSELRLWPVRDADGVLTAFQFMVRDVTERRRTGALLDRQRRQLAKRAQELRAVNEQLNDFAATVSHDLRAPLRRIHRRLEAIAASSPDQTEALTEISEEAQGLQEFVEHILTIARTHGQPLRRERVDLAGLFRQCVDERCQEFGRRCEVLGADGAVEVFADRHLLGMLVSNLVENAFRHSDAQNLRLVLDVRRDQARSTYRIVDNGRGFETPLPRNLFDSYYQGATGPAAAGYGVGLATARGIVSRHGGSIRAYNDAGGGAALEFTLGDEVSE